jgi:hypothetical protein
MVYGWLMMLVEDVVGRCSRHNMLTLHVSTPCFPSG